MTFPGDTAVLVLAAGPGTRMRSDTPKVLHTLAGRSMLSHVLHAIAKLAPQRLIVVLGHDHQRIAPLVGELADTLGRTIDVALQDRPLGTGHAVLCGLSALPDDYAGNVVVTSGDTPLLDADTLADLIATHRAVSAAVTVLTTTLDDPFGYGRILRTQDHEVMAIVEQTDATPSQREIREVNAGVYAFDIAALRSALSRLSSNNAQQELYLTDVIAILRSDGQTVHASHVDDSALVAGVNNRVQLAELASELNRRVVAAHQLAGVTVVDPATTWIDVDVTIGRDTVIHPGTQLLGRTQIGGRCVVGPDTTLTDVAVGDGASVVRTHGSSSSIGDGAAVGPFTYLRPGTALGADGKLGAFVEVKNSTIGTGTKVPHLPTSRRRHRRVQQHRRLQRVRQLRRYVQTAHHRRFARTDRVRHHVRGPSNHRRRRVYRGRHSGAGGCPAGGAGSVGGSATQHRELGAAQTPRQPSGSGLKKSLRNGLPTAHTTTRR